MRGRPALPACTRELGGEESAKRGRRGRGSCVGAKIRIVGEKGGKKSGERLVEERSVGGFHEKNALQQKPCQNECLDTASLQRLVEVVGLVILPHATDINSLDFG